MVASVFVLVGILVAVVLIIVNSQESKSEAGQGSLNGVTQPRQTDLEALRSSCGLSYAYATIGDSGHTLTIKGQGEESSGVNWSDIECVLHNTKMPASVRGRFDSTRALDGMQSATWSGYSATWNYHPDSGVNLIITSVG